MKLAFIGFRHPHIFTLYKLAQERPDIEIVATCEEHAETQASLAQSNQVSLTHTSYETLLSEVDCDVIAVGDYYGIRGERIIQALEAGKHVMVDKPVCTSLSELDKIENLLATRSIKLGCMLTMRDGAQTIGLRSLVQSGLIGEVHAISFGGQHGLKLGTRAAWYFEPGKHGGTINDIGIHAIDALPWITGLEYAEIQAARTWNAFAPDFPHFHDAAQVMLSMNNGCGVLGDVSYFMPNSMAESHPLYWQMTIWGTKGVLETAMNLDYVRVGLNGEPEPRKEALPTGTPGGYLQAFIDDINGKADAETGIRNSDRVIKSARTVLTIQQVADENRPSALQF
ncbi:MAG: Gfo/Idh/MocA family oxidoreductase [Chloroflexota bacterium]